MERVLHLFPFIGGSSIIIEIQGESWLKSLRTDGSLASLVVGAFAPGGRFEEAGLGACP